MADNIAIKDATGRSAVVSTEEIGKLNGETVTSQHVQRTAPVYISESGSGIDGEQPLTNEQLRASEVPVSLSGVATSIKQDTLISSLSTVIVDLENLYTELQLKANLTDTQPISGSVTANTGLTQPLTDTQLRASNVNVEEQNFSKISVLNSIDTSLNDDVYTWTGDWEESGDYTEINVSFDFSDLTTAAIIKIEYSQDGINVNGYTWSAPNCDLPDTSTDYNLRFPVKSKYFRLTILIGD